MTTPTQMGDDTVVFPMVKRRKAKRKIGFPATLNLYIRRLGSFERGNFTRPILRKGVRTKSLAPFLFGGGKGVSKYLHVFFGLNPFLIYWKCIFVLRTSVQFCEGKCGIDDTDNGEGKTMGGVRRNRWKIFGKTLKNP